MSRIPSLSVLLLAACSNAEPEPAAPLPPASLSLEYPATGSWLPLGPTVVQGSATGLLDLSLDGVAVESGADRWAVEVDLPRGVSTLEVRGVDHGGDPHFRRTSVLAGDFGHPSGQVPEAVWVLLTPEGLDMATATAPSLIDAAELEATVMADNPVAYDPDPPLISEYAVYLTHLDFGTPVIEASPDIDALAVSVRIPDFDVALEIEGCWLNCFFDFDTGASATVDEVQVDADIWLDVVDGALTVQLANPVVTLHGFDFDLTAIPSDIESSIGSIRSAVQSFLEETLVEQLHDTVPAAIDEALAGLDLSFETEVLDTLVQLDAAFASVSIDPDGVALGVDIGVALPDLAPLEKGGVLMVDRGRPSPPVDGHLGMALSDDLVNRILFEVWQAELLELSLSTEDGTLEPALLAQVHAETGSVTVSAGLPPVAVHGPDGIEIQVGALEVVLDTPGGEFGDHLVLDVSAALPVVPVIEDGAVGLSLVNPRITMTVVETDWRASHETIANVLADQLPLDTLLSAVSDVSFPIPSFEGVGISSATVEHSAGRGWAEIGVVMGVEAPE